MNSKQPTKLNLACGSKPRKGFINLDIAKIEGVDVVWDLDLIPWCFEDETITAIEAWDIFEHVKDSLGFMAECHRILKPGRQLHIHTGYYANPNSFTDPTHVRFPTQNTFDYWVPGTFLYDTYGDAYGGHKHPFEKVDIHVDDTNYLDVTLRKLSA